MSTRPNDPLPRDQIAAAVRAIRRARAHLWKFVAVVAIGVAATAAFARLRPRHYLSQSVVYYQEGFAWGDAQGDGTRRVGQRLRDTVLARTKLQQVITELGLYPRLVAADRIEDAIDEMRRDTSFRINEGDTFTIGFIGHSPAEAQRVTARLTELLIEDNARLRSEQIDLAKSFLDAKRKEAEELVRRKEAELARFVAKHPELAQLGGTSPIRMPTRDAVVVAVPAAPTDPAVTAARAALAAAEGHVAAARRDYDAQRRRFTDKHPAVVSAAAALKDAEDDYARAQAAFRAVDAGRESRPAPVVSAPRSGAPRVSVAALEEHARLTRELEEARDRFSQLDTRQFVASMAASSFTGGHSAQITIIDPAYLPARPTGTRSIVLLLGGGAASVALGLALVILLVFLDDRVYDRGDVDRLRVVRVIGEVLGASAARPGATPVPATPPYPLLPPATDQLPLALGPAAAEPAGPDAPGAAAGARAIEVAGGAPPGGHDRAAGRRNGVAADPGVAAAFDPRLLVLLATDSPAAASFRVLRQRLAELGGPRCILVTSPDPGEGKTTCAVNLAMVLAEAGRANVLLLDANLRNPSLGKLLGGAARHDEVTDAGAGARTPWAVIHRVTPSLRYAELDPGLDPGLIDGLAMRERLEELGAGDYDYIVLDGPAILGSADANVLQESATAVLMTLWAQRSRLSRVRQAVDQIGARKILGAVVLTGSA